MKCRFTVLLSCILFTFFFTGCQNQSASQTDSAAAEEVSALPATEEATASEPIDEPIAESSTVEEAEPELPPVKLPAAEYRLTIKYSSELLKNAVDGSNPDKTLNIYLPASYYDSEKRYPVVYFFHGLGLTPHTFYRDWEAFAQYMQADPDKELIVVEVDGRTVRDNFSFYVNSEVTGLWEDYVTTEIVPFVDENYRTIADASSRGAAGFSSGGFSCINLTLRHPDIFSCVQAISPGLLKDEDLPEALNGWNATPDFLTAYGRAFAPDPKAESLYNVPVLDGSPEDNALCEKWLDGFGHLDQKISDYLALNKPLNNIQIIYGAQDPYPLMLDGAKYFCELLEENGFDEPLIELQMGHTIPEDYIGTYFVPFFSSSLNFNE
ncbi:alpha/beta hydrolase [Kineothrix sedimenti]|uniref:Alpha/beta hydrolase-fold protein n=1 Tax=Kineothrix sedimenti TaxID=3123317 RepID=A0ABZ3EQI7_9FIRM